MVVRRFVIGITVHGIGNTVVAYVHKNKEVFASDRFRDDAFALSGAKTVAGSVRYVVIRYITLESGVIFCYIFHITSEIDEMIVYLFS